MKTIAYNFFAACGCVILTFIMAAILDHIQHIAHIGRAGGYAFLALSFLLFYFANRGIMKGKSPFIRHTVVVLLSFLLAYVWNPICVSIWRSWYVGAGGHIYN